MIEMIKIKGIHHISAIVTDIERNLDFYTKILNMRLVKTTVNHDDKYTYHLYFANDKGEVGSVITFFYWNNKNIGRVGTGQVVEIALSIPKGSLSYWITRLNDFGVQTYISKKYGKSTIEFKDPDNISLALVEGEVEDENNKIYSIYGVELLSRNPLETKQSLEKDFGVTNFLENENEYRAILDNGNILIIPKKRYLHGIDGVGTIHHIAFSIENVNYAHEYLEKNNFNPTIIKNRYYFKSIYFRDRGHIVFELATETPGFTYDESLEELGRNFVLPRHFEMYRKEIEKALEVDKLIKRLD